MLITVNAIITQCSCILSAVNAFNQLLLYAPKVHATYQTMRSCKLPNVHASDVDAILQSAIAICPKVHATYQMTRSCLLPNVHAPDVGIILINTTMRKPCMLLAIIHAQSCILQARSCMQVQHIYANILFQCPCRSSARPPNRTLDWLLPAYDDQLVWHRVAPEPLLALLLGLLNLGPLLSAQPLLLQCNSMVETDQPPC